MTRLALAAKAEIVLGAHLVIRHRAPRLAALLCLVILGLVVVRGIAAGDPAEADVVLLVAGTLTAVGASRLLAPGAALAGARASGSSWWLIAAGRIVGLLLIALPLVAISAVVVGGVSRHGVAAGRLGSIAMTYAAAVAGAVVAITPLVGSSAAAAVGLVGAWFGGIGPSSVSMMLGRWPLVRGPAVLIWNVSPLKWRAARWAVEANFSDVSVLICWIALGILLSAWTTAVRYRGEVPPAGDAP
ncbi:MAG: hypothetical protein ACE5HT_01585 [Gemmatimonadales bacterium]